MKYFTYNELTKSATAARLGIDNTPNATEKANLKAVVDNILDPLREKWGAPIVVSSGFRCKRLNEKVGGSKTSQHCLGQAVDIRTVSDKPSDNHKLLHLIIEMGLPFDQLISEYVDDKGRPDWVHVSFSPRHRRQKLTCKAGKFYTGIK